MPRKKKPTNRRHSRRHVLDVKVRSSKRRQVRFRTAALLLLVVGAIGLGGMGLRRGGKQLLTQFIYDNPAFAIHNLEIETDGSISLEQVRRWTGVKPEDNLFGLDLERVQRDLELVPAIRSASIERVLPHTLRIRVFERQPVGEVNFPKPGGMKRYVLDAEGYVMFPLEQYQLKPNVVIGVLPSLIGVRVMDLQPGRAPESREIKAALRLVGVFNRSDMVGLVRMETIDVQSPGLLTVRTDQGCLVTFGLTDFEAQLRRWRAVYDHGLRAGRRLKTLDLSVTNNLPAQWVDQDTPPARRSQQQQTTTFKGRHV